MNKDLDKILDEFISDDENEEVKFNEKVKQAKKELLTTKSGLIERVDKILVTEDGRQLLREWY
jgi:hypothetical protein